MNDTSIPVTIAVIGGTGREGKGLAYRWARAGYHLIIGSRSADRAIAAALEISQLLAGESKIVGMSNPDAARQASIIVLTVPYDAHREILETIRPATQGKTVIDATVPLVPGKLSMARMPAAGSAALETRELLGEGVHVAAAFHNISYEYLLQDGWVDCDVLVTGTSEKAREETLKLVSAAHLKGWDAGPLENSAVSEGLASVLIHINRKYGSKHAGIRVTGISEN